MKQIKLSQGKVALVDDEDYEELNKYKWYSYKGGNTFYAGRNFNSNGKQKTIKMHRIIMNTPKEMETDHIDGNGLNNQKSNLRIVTHRQNGQNKRINKSSRFVGVCWNEINNKWRAQIKINKKHKSLGVFDTELEAHNAYQNKLKEINELFIDLLVD